MLELKLNGLVHNGKVYQVDFKAIIADAPARSLLKCIIGHFGYEACERCTQRGVHLEGFGVRIFPEIDNLTLRTKQSFENQTHKNHHSTINKKSKQTKKFHF